MNDRLRDALVGGIPAFERSRRRRFAILVPGLVALVIAGIVVLAATRPAPDARTVTAEGTAPTPTPEATPETTPLPVLTVPPIEEPSAVPSVLDLVRVGDAHDLGNGLVMFWDASDRLGGGRQFGGAVLDTSTGELTALEVPPETGLDDRAVAAGGGEVLVCCANGVAKLWNSSDGWRTNEVPVSGAGFGVWTHSDFVVLAGRADAGPGILDPGTGSWSESLAPYPAELGFWDRFETAWAFRPDAPNGEAFYVWPSPPTRTTHDGFAFDPGRESGWRRLPQIQGDAPAIVSLLAPDGHLVVGGGLPAAGGGSERFVLWVLPSDSTEWVQVDLDAGEPDSCECNLGSQTMLWTGSELLVHLGALGSGIDPDGALFSVTDLASGGRAELVGQGTEALRPLTMVGDEVLWARADGAILLGERVLID